MGKVKPNVCPVCDKKLEEPSLPGDLCDECLEDDRQSAWITEEIRQERELDAKLRKRP